MNSLTQTQRRRFPAAGLALGLAALAILTACGKRTAASNEDGAGSSSSAATLTVPDKNHPSPAYRSVPATADDDVLTYHNDLARTGLDPGETILTPANVNAASFGRLFSDPVDGFVYAQPLYMSGVSIPGKGTHNVVYVATENDTVYALDADRAGPPLWRASLLEGGSAVPSTAFACGQIVPRVGITGTPVIDRATGTLYVVAMIEHTASGHTTYAQRLHALNIATGAEKPGGPVTIAGSVPGKGAGNNGGKLAFDGFLHLNRPGLALANGVIYIAFGSHCDLGDYHGWVMAYGAGDLRLRAAFSTTPNGSQGAIWETGDAPAVDAKGNVYVLTGNGTFSAASRGADYSDSFLKLALSGNTLRAIDFFTPYDEKGLDEQDLDIGSGGALLVPDQTGQHAHLVVGAGKNGVIYVVDRDHLGRYNANGDAQIVQAVRGQISPNFSTPAYWNGHIYIGSASQPLKAFAVTGKGLSAAPVSQSPDSFDYPGTTPAVSSNGNKNAIVWGLDTGGYVAGSPTILRAYDATDLAHELYTNAHTGRGGPGVKFATPTVAHGMVYYGTQNSLEVYGLLRH
ncbi:MAG: pyrrolo-quinoline quinone [Acidobacteriota bacterium]|nr:pyrrolo-quinoline quinone [Acidobacteriota bacterium]